MQIDSRTKIAINTPSREQTREYILALIGTLVGMARQSGETSLAIHLKAILDAARAERGSSA